MHAVYEEAELATMVNISDEEVRIEIGTTPGRRPYVIMVPPSGAQKFDRKLCEPIQGSGRAIRQPIICTLSVRDGKPRLVPERVARKDYGWTGGHAAAPPGMAAGEGLSPEAEVKFLEERLSKARARAGNGHGEFEGHAEDHLGEADDDLAAATTPKTPAKKRAPRKRKPATRRAAAE